MFGTARHGSGGVRNDSEGLMAKKAPLSHKIRDWLQDRALRVIIGGALLLPYGIRVRAGGWLFANILAPIAGYSTRIRDNLNLIFPDLPTAEVTRLIHAVANNTGRTVIEIYSGAQFVQRVIQTPLTGPGLAALEQAHETKRPVILVTGHFGNYDASRAGLIARGFRVGALYNPMGNRFFNSHYVRAISRIGTPLFPRGKRGLGEMVRFLRGGGMLGLLMDQRIHRAPLLPFLGQPARTAFSAADLALRYDALLVPTYAIRRADGLSFDIVIEQPIPHSTPQEMTLALNVSLEAQVRSHPDQWFWIHRRWRP